MNEVRRHLLFSVMAEESFNDKMLRAMHHVNNLVRADEVLVWCIKNKLVGARFLQFTQSCGGIFDAMSEILRRVHRESSRHAVVDGVDYVDNVVNFQSFNRGKK